MQLLVRVASALTASALVVAATVAPAHAADSAGARSPTTRSTLRPTPTSTRTGSSPGSMTRVRVPA